MTLSHKEFTDRLFKKHDGRIQMLGRHTSIRNRKQFRCDEGHTWIAIASNVAYLGKGCPDCAGNKKITDKVYKSLLKEKFKGRVKPLELIKGVKTKIEHICNEGHKFCQSPTHVLRKNSASTGCPVCYRTTHKARPNRRSSNEDYQKRLHEVSNGKFSTTELYQGRFVKIEHECSNGHTWKSIPANILSGSGCPYCKSVAYSKSAVGFLKTLSKKIGVDIQHAENGGEKAINIGGKLHYVDGYIKPGIIVEFYGDNYHGNIDRFSLDAHCHPFNKNITAYELYMQTANREEMFRDKGLHVFSIWESEYKDSKAFQHWIKTNVPLIGRDINSL